MALVKDPLARARAAKTELQAARLKQELEIELALNENTPAGWDEQADQAVSLLDERFTDLDDVDVSGGRSVRLANGSTGQVASKWTPSLSHGAKKGLTAPDDEEAQADLRDTSQPAKERWHARARQHLDSGAGRAARGARRGGRRAYRQTGIPQAAGNAAGTALSFVGVAVGLSLLYLLLNNAGKSAPGRSAIELVTGGFAQSLARLVSPEADLLPGGPKGSKALLPYDALVHAGIAAGPPTPASLLDKNGFPKSASRPRQVRSPSTPPASPTATKG